PVDRGRRGHLCRGGGGRASRHGAWRPPAAPRGHCHAQCRQPDRPPHHPARRAGARVMLETWFDTYASDYSAYKQGDWCYEDGCIYRGLVLLDIADPDGPWFAHLKRLVDNQVGPEGQL